ncbi:MAG: hypothetical protein ACI4C1_10770 [Lachnospiraceae bacterium]
MNQKNVKNEILIVYAIGILLGTILINKLPKPYIERAIIFQSYYTYLIQRQSLDFRLVFFQLVIRRGIVFLILNLSLNNPLGKGLIPGFVFLYATSLSALSALWIRANGVMGLYSAVLNCFPHMVCYISAWFVLHYGLQGYRVGMLSSRTVCILVSMLLFLAGILMELFISLFVAIYC